MAISSSQQEVLKVVIGLFNVAPGKANFDALSSLLEGDNAMTPLQIAEALDDIPLFVDSIMGSATTTAAQVNVLMSHFGLSTAGDLNPNSAASVAHTYFTDRIENGDSFGSIVYDAVVFLSGSVATEFAATAALLSNKAAVAEYWSVTKGLSAATLEELGNVISKVTATSDVSSDAAIEALIAQATDSVSPVATPATFSFAENVADATTALGTVTATDNSTVTGFEIVSGNDSGFFAIDSAGQITLTDAGTKSAANDFETTPNSFTLGVNAIDAAGNKSSTVDIVLNVTDVDDVAPAFVGATAATGSNKVTVNFGEALKAGNPAATAFTVKDGSTIVGVTAAAVNGSAVTLTLASNIGGTVTVGYDSANAGNKLQDAAGNIVANFDNKTVSSDATAPTLSSSTPADNGTLGKADNVVLTFSEDVTLGSGNITIVNSGDSKDTRTIAVNDASQVTVSGTKVTINPTADLVENGTYYINIPNTAVLDKAGNAYAGISDLTTLNFSAAATTAVGQTFTLTSTTDVISGTAGNDTILGEIGTTATVNASDQINGGAGTDVFKIFGSFTAGTSNTGVISNIETLFLGTLAAGAQDFTTLSKAATGIEKIEINNAAAANNTITTTAGQSLSLATAGGAATAGAVTWAGSITDTSLNLTLNGYQGGSGVTPLSLSVTGAAATTLNIASTGSVNKVATLTGPTTVTSHVITGDKSLQYSTAAADSAALNSINAGSSTGGVTALMNAALTKATFTFTGGSGNDTVTFISDEFGTLTAGTQLVGGAGTDKIGLFDVAITNAEAAKIQAANSFEKIGLNAAITLDASLLSNFKTFDLDTTALAQTINNLATGSAVNVGLDATAAFTQAALTLSGAVGVSDATVNIGATTDTLAHTITALTVTGLTNVKISSNGTGANVITTLTNSDNSTITVTGSNALTITNALSGTATGSKLDASAATGAITATGSGQADILIGGSGADTFTAGAGADTQTGNGGVDKFIFSTADIDTTAGAVTDTITDFVSGTDRIAHTVGAAAGSTTNYVEASSAAGDLATLLTAADAALNGTVLFYAGQVGSDSYLVFDQDGTGYTDVIKLTGVSLSGIALGDIFAS